MNNLFFIVFMVFVVVMLALDLFVFHKKDHVVGVKEAALQTGMWIALAMGFAALLYFHAEWVHGVPMSTAEKHEIASQFLAGYFLEESLSIDNIFVMIMIFVSFGIKKEYYHRVLFWGILGAIVLRFIFIFALGALVNKFAWVLAVFGAFLVFSGLKMFRKKEEKIDTANHPVVKFCSRYFRATPNIDGHNFFSRIDGKNYITPLFIVLLVIEFSDIIFAVDSIPAVYGVTQDPEIVFFSNIFAVMGLRSLFFLMSNVADRFWLLQYGLGVLLVFIGAKMLLHQFVPDFDITAIQSLFIILGILTVSIVLSLIIKRPTATREDCGA